MRLLAIYFVLTFTVSWTCFISVAYLSHETESSSTLALLEQGLVLLGAIAPSLVSIGLCGYAGKPGDVQRLVRSVGRWEVNLKWYVFAAGFILTLKLVVALLFKIITGAWPEFGGDLWYVMFVAVVFSTPVQAGEEIGWRGFALPRMSARFGLPLATILLGLLWACWHLPLFFVKGASTFGQSFPLYVIQVTGLSVVLGWLFWKTEGSLLITMLMHAAINNTKDIVPSAVSHATDPFALSHSLVAWLTVALLWAFAAFCLLNMRHGRSPE